MQIGGAFSAVFLPGAAAFAMMGHAAPALPYFVVSGYGWACRRLYQRALASELRSVELRKNF